MNQQAVQVIINFLALPSTAMPSASYIDADANDYADAWQTLRNAAAGDTSEWIDGPIRLRADRDGWRDGVVVSAAPTPDQVRAARKSAGLTQEQAARVIGATRRAWQEWEAGRRNMPAAKWELFQIKVKTMGKKIELELVRSDEGNGGWSLHPAGYTAEQYTDGDVPVLASGTAEWDDDAQEWDRPNAADYARAERAAKKL